MGRSDEEGTGRARDERGAGGLRNLLVTVLTVVVVGALAVVLPGLAPGLRPLGPFAGDGPLVQVPAADAGSVPDTPLERTRDGGSYRFSAVQPGGGAPVTYRPCEPIEVVVNLRGAPDPEDDLRMVLDGLDRIGAATGLDLRYVGGSERRPEWESGGFEVSREELDDPEPVLVSFADAAEVPQLQGQVAGIAGSVLVEDGDEQERRYLTGQVTLDSDSLAELRSQDDGREVAAAITLHELAHLVGLDHVDDPTELMYAVTTDQRDLGPGDAEGLRRLGPGDAGC